MEGITTVVSTLFNLAWEQALRVEKQGGLFMQDEHIESESTALVQKTLPSHCQRHKTCEGSGRSTCHRGRWGYARSRLCTRADSSTIGGFTIALINVSASQFKKHTVSF
jgi:hypothetical protein